MDNHCTGLTQTWMALISAPKGILGCPQRRGYRDRPALGPNYYALAQPQDEDSIYCNILFVNRALDLEKQGGEFFSDLGAPIGKIVYAPKFVINVSSSS